MVIGNKDPDFPTVPEAVARGDQVLVDFAVRMIDRRSKNGKYDGICW